MLSHGALPNAKFFMIALPEHFYFWKDAEMTPELTAPTFEIDAKLILQPYLDESGVSVRDMTGQSFELIVTAWLNSILQTGKQVNYKNDMANWVNSSGLSAALNGGYLKYEVVL